MEKIYCVIEKNQSDGIRIIGGYRLEETAKNYVEVSNALYEVDGFRYWHQDICVVDN